MPYEIRDKDRDDNKDIYIPTPEEAAMLEEAIAELERGEYVDWEDVREAFLRRNPGSSTTSYMEIMRSEMRDKGCDEDVYVPTPEEAAFLEESIAQFERGESLDWDEARANILHRRR